MNQSGIIAIGIESTPLGALLCWRGIIPMSGKADSPSPKKPFRTLLRETKRENARLIAKNRIRTRTHTDKERTTIACKPRRVGPVWGSDQLSLLRLSNFFFVSFLFRVPLRRRLLPPALSFGHFNGNSCKRTIKRTSVHWKKCETARKAAAVATRTEVLSFVSPA